MTEVADWLDRRRPAMPVELRLAVDAALSEAGGVAGDLPDVLAHAALETLSNVASAPSDRSTAAELLAADALLTYACEAAAEAGADRLENLVSSLDRARFASLLPATSS